MGINIDKWIGPHKVRAFPWVDGKRIYFNVQYFRPGQSISAPPAWDNTVYITNNSAGQNLVCNFTHTLVEYVSKMQIKDGVEVTLTA